MWQWLLGTKNPQTERAKRRVKARLPNARICVTGHAVIAAEWFKDLDGKSYRLEYVLRDSGDRTKAYCRSKPSFLLWFWKRRHYSFSECHLHEDGTICLGTPNVMSFERAVDRARFWANTYTFLIQHGLAETRRTIPEW